MPVYYYDKDWNKRVPQPKQQVIKNIENLAIAASKTCKHLRTHIVGTGVIYGNGELENCFYEHFRRAWLSLHPRLAELPVVGDGLNRLPTIHAHDLA